VRTKQKLHVTVGHVTVMAELHFWGVPESQGVPRSSALQAMTCRIGALSARVLPPPPLPLLFKLHQSLMSLMKVMLWRIGCVKDHCLYSLL